MPTSKQARQWAEHGLCPNCGGSIEWEPDYVGVSATCPNCYDVDCAGDPPRYVATWYTGHAKSGDPRDAMTHYIDDVLDHVLDQEDEKHGVANEIARDVADD